MKDVELLANIFHSGGDKVIGLVVGVDPKQVRHDQEVPIGGENCLELVGSVDNCRHAIPVSKGKGLNCLSRSQSYFESGN